MSVYFSMHMTCVDGNKKMEELLKGIVRPKVIHRYESRGGAFEVQTRDIPNSLDLRVLDADAAQKELAEAKKRGFTVKTLSDSDEHFEQQGFELVGKDGSFSVFSRPWDKEVLDDIFEAPVFYSNEGQTLCWSGNYHCDERIDPAVSRYFPELTFDVVECVEGEVVAHYELRNGEVVKDYLEGQAC